MTDEEERAVRERFEQLRDLSKRMSRSSWRTIRLLGASGVFWWIAFSVWGFVPLAQLVGLFLGATMIGYEIAMALNQQLHDRQRAFLDDVGRTLMEAHIAAAKRIDQCQSPK
jgi:uncharacterized membrane protein